MKIKEYASFVRGYYIGLYYITKALVAVLKFIWRNRRYKVESTTTNSPMTIVEFRMFFEALPDKFETLKNPLPTKKAFGLECNIPLAYLKEMTLGTRSFTEATISKILPVMRKYGFQG